MFKYKIFSNFIKGILYATLNIVDFNQKTGIENETPIKVMFLIGVFDESIGGY
jgi:hypothetical protein